MSEVLAVCRVHQLLPDAGTVGVTAIGVLAWSRGEPVNALWVVIASVCVFAVAYRFHSAWLMAKVLTLDDMRATPAVVHEDGKDFVQTNKWIVFGHHFAAIAGPASATAAPARSEPVIETPWMRGSAMMRSMASVTSSTLSCDRAGYHVFEGRMRLQPMS